MILDNKYKKLLYFLSENARYTNLELSKKIGLSKDAVAYRIARLEEEQIIQGYHTRINNHRLGLLTFRVALHLVNFTSEKETALVQHLSQTPHVHGVSINEGAWSVSYVISVRTLAELYEVDNKLLLQFKKIISRRHITPIVHYDFLPKRYLVNTRTQAINTFEPSNKRINIDETDIKILNILQIHARSRLIDIAKQIGTSSMLVLQRMRKLEAKQIITSYQANIDTLKLNKDYYGVKVTLNSWEELSKMRQYIYTIPQMTGFLYSLGEYDLEFDLEVDNTKQYRDIISDLREKFSTIREITYLKTSKYFIRNPILS